ncbi:hypothetical protein Tco_0490137 [Tanacetum coccineum]
MTAKKNKTRIKKWVREYRVLAVAKEQAKERKKTDEGYGGKETTRRGAENNTNRERKGKPRKKKWPAKNQAERQKARDEIRGRRQKERIRNK